MAIGQLRLADKSAWEQARYDRRARDRLHELRQAKQLAICVLSSLPYLHMTEAAERQVEELMGALATRGQHRTPIPGLMLAAIAHTNSAVVLHYDSDYERIAAVTDQGHCWPVSPVLLF